MICVIARPRRRQILRFNHFYLSSLVDQDSLILAAGCTSLLPRRPSVVRLRRCRRGSVPARLGLRMLWGRVYRPRVKLALPSEPPLRPLTPLSLSDYARSSPKDNLRARPGLRMLWGRVYRPRVKLALPSEPPLRPLTPLSLSDHARSLCSLVLR
ncbi:uncharacterized protein LOC120456138 [Drosophila santomea]|uniref:uncharacterized protein LOC120456138 n=1 Tax=Drosophila santomea TaxID=129105 RepID=UPI001954C9C2|nr:uncharacterized protein LOC120456138 [Drosophila santomea]